MMTASFEVGPLLALPVMVLAVAAVVVAFVLVPIPKDIPIMASALVAGLILQPPGGAPMTDVSLIERALREGGFFAIILILLYFYRRDTKWATEFWKDQAAEFAVCIKENTKSQVEIASALRENNVVVHQAKNLLASHLHARE